MQHQMTFRKRLMSGLLTMFLIATMGLSWSAPAMAATSTAFTHYNNDEKPVVNSFRSNYQRTLANSIVGRAIWYMEYGFIVYGHSKYPSTGYCDCSNYVSMVYKDFGYSITSASKDYNRVGVAVGGVTCRNNVLSGVDHLKPGDIFTFWTTANTGSRHIGHVAIYIGKILGKPRIIGTLKGNPTAIGIMTGLPGWYGDHFNGVRRVLPASAFKTGGKIRDRGPVIPVVYRMVKFTRVILPQNLQTGF